MQLKPLPAEMHAVLMSTTDYRQPDAGAGPVWLQIASGDHAAELVVYRALADGELYVLAPS